MSPSRMAGPHCPNPAQEPERKSDTPRCDAAFINNESVYLYAFACQLERELNKWRALAVDAVATAKACILAVPISDTERWQAIKDLEKRLDEMEKK